MKKGILLGKFAAFLVGWDAPKQSLHTDMVVDFRRDTSVFRCDSEKNK